MVVHKDLEAQIKNQYNAVPRHLAEAQKIRSILRGSENSN